MREGLGEICKKQQITTMSNKKCILCQTYNPDEAIFCRHCGAKLDNSPEIESFNYVSIPHVGDSIELTWSIKNADTAFLNGQTMPLSHRYKVVVDEEMTLELVATRSGKRESKRIHIVPIPSSDKTTKLSTPPLVTTSDALPYLVKVLLEVLVIDIFPVISLIIISCCSSWLRYTLNLSYNDWNGFRVYANILLCIWVASGIVWGFLRFHRYKKI